MITKKKIGGEFEISPSDLLESGFSNIETPFLYSNGRSALRSILKHIKNIFAHKIYIPYYICPSVVDACIASGFEVAFYELNQEFLFPLDYIDRIDHRAVLLSVNYFGLVNDETVVDTVKELRGDVCVISDHVMSFWTYKSSNADYSFTSLRKHFGIPEGGMVYTNDLTFINNETLKVNSFYKDKYLGAFLKSAKVSDRLFLDFLESGEQILDSEVNDICQASPLAYLLWGKVNQDLCKKMRQKNTSYIYEQGAKLGINFIFKNLPVSVVAQHIPIWIENGIALRKALFKKDIYLPIHWPIQPYNKHSELSQRMHGESVSLVIDHRYDTKDMARLLNSLSVFL